MLSRMLARILSLVALLALLAGTGWIPPKPASAGEADVVAAKVTKSQPGVYRFDVTVAHGDKGWEHYANKWEVIAPDGRVLGTRVLAHPHDHEQPFTRSLPGVRIPSGVGSVTIRAYDLVHGEGGKTVRLRISD